MYKDGQTFCLDLVISLLHKIGSCSTLYFCAVKCELPESYDRARRVTLKV